mgnify:CR=1 FL=1
MPSFFERRHLSFIDSFKKMILMINQQVIDLDKIFTVTDLINNKLISIFAPPKQGFKFNV